MDKKYKFFIAGRARNKDNILEELTTYIDCLNHYKDAIATNDEERLIQILDEGRKRKEEVDG